MVGVCESCDLKLISRSFNKIFAKHKQLCEHTLLFYYYFPMFLGSLWSAPLPRNGWLMAVFVVVDVVMYCYQLLV